jgi:hypothetical protein
MTVAHPVLIGGNKGKHCLGFDLMPKKQQVKQSLPLFVTYFTKTCYMHKVLLSAILIGASLKSFSQKTDLAKFEKERVRYSKNAMVALAGWSVANIVGSGIATDTRNKEMRNFHQMNVMWGGINLAIAGLAYWGAGREKIDNPTLESVQKHQRKIEKTYLINLGLDVVYVGSGLLMNKTSDNQKNPEKFKGYGNSIMVQGGFLLLYDAVMYATHRKHGKLLKGMGDKVTLNAGPGAVSLTYNF